jgi:hypothetical protein
VNGADATRPRVTLHNRPIWRLRITREAPRLVLGALSLFGLAASARYAIAPPQPARVLAAARGSDALDLGAQAYAVRFVRSYLAWRASEPVASARELEGFTGSQMASAAGLVLPAAGEEQVGWAEVVQAREPQPGLHVLTVAAQTSTEGLRYVAVPVERTADGSLALEGYPAFVGAPASAPALSPPRLRQVGDRALEVVVRRALVNYLSASTAELAADLAPGARVSAPAAPLRVLSSEQPQWAPGGGAVLVLLQAADERGAQYALSYEVDVSRAQGRWEISAIEADPDA